MRSEISALIRKPLYNELRDHASVALYPTEPHGFARPLWFLDHDFREGGDGGDDGASKSNDGEAEWICAIVRYVARQGYEPEQIAVLTPYVGQLLLLRKKLVRSQILLYVDDRDLDELAKIADDDDDEDDNNDNNDNNNNNSAATNSSSSKMSTSSGSTKSASLASRIRISTVDNFQGEEAKVVIISTVRSNARGSTGFLKISNRVNVMLSRAKHGMCMLIFFLFVCCSRAIVLDCDNVLSASVIVDILGNQQTLLNDKRAKLFHSVLSDLQQSKLIGKSLPLRCRQHHKEFFAASASEIPADGGCSSPCGKVIA